MTVLKLNNISQKYDNNFVLHNISFEVNKGEILSILGPNGAGKTTLIKIITGFLEPTFGEVDIKNNTKVGVVFGGDLGFYNNLSGEENLKFFAHLKKINRKEIDNQVKLVLTKVNLWDSRKKRVSAYSKGMKQRLHIARALLNDPQFLLLDEPTNGLDIEIANEIRKLILTLKENGYTIILTSHVVTDIENLSNRIIMLNEGKMKYDCKIEELLEITNEVNFEKAYLSLIESFKEINETY